MYWTRSNADGSGLFFWLILPLSWATDSYSCSLIQPDRVDSMVFMWSITVPEQHRAEHSYIGARHEHLQHVEAGVDSACGRQADL